MTAPRQATGSGAGPAPGKPRPSWWWFVVGGALLVAAVVVAVGLFVWSVGGLVRTDAAVPADGQMHRVNVGTDGDRFLWFQRDAAGECTIRATATGSVVELRPVSGQYSRTLGGSDWVAVSRFDPATGDLEVTCTSSAGSVEIGPALEVISIIGRVLAAIVVPLALGAAGLLVLLVTGILYLTRPPRPHQR